MMSKIISTFVALVLSAVMANATNAQTTPNAFKSLQPFNQFAKGAGEGIAYEYKARTKAQFVALLRNKQLAKKEMRVTCDVLVRQMMESHPELPFEGCEGAAVAIESGNDFTVVACRNEMFQRKNFLTVTNEKGTAFGVWHRKCLQNERVLVYKGQPLISLTCLNVAIPVFIPPTPPKQACAEIHFFARAGDTVARNAVGGGTAFQDDCFAIKKVGDAEFRAPWKDSCASEHCTFAASEAFLNKKMWMLASYELEEGEYILRVPASFAEKNSPYVTILCLERTKIAWPEFPPKEYTQVQMDVYAIQRLTWIDGHSDSVNVWWNAYRVDNDGISRARIYYTETEVPASETVKMYWRWGVLVAEHPQQYRSVR